MHSVSPEKKKKTFILIGYALIGYTLDKLFKMLVIVHDVMLSL